MNCSTFMHGVVLDRNSLDKGDLDFSRLEATLGHWRYFDATTPQDTPARIANAQVVITNKVQLSREILAQASALKLVCVAATGTNNVDLEAAKHHGITVCNARGYATSSVVQHVFGLILALARQLPQYQQAVAAGRWQRSAQFCLLDFPIEDLSDKTLGIVGYGELGQAVARMAEAHGMKVLVAQRPGTETTPPGRIPLEDLLASADVLTLHCPLSSQTRNLIGAAQLSLMKSSAFLINTARGGIVDENALADALRHGRLAGAGVDVLSAEPPVSGNPLLAADIPNLIVTPHIAWASRQSRQRLIDDVAANIEAFMDGRRRNVVS